MAYDMMSEAMKAVLRGELDVHQLTDQIDTIAKMHILTKVSSDEGNFDIELEPRKGGTAVHLRVETTVISGQEMIDKVKNEVEEIDRKDIPTLMNDVIHRHDKDDEPKGNWK